ncbi:MAG: nucleotide disphospho-sugar-binding domain-containing protein [Cyanobacteria bacterium P01_F01_bin.3]
MSHVGILCPATMGHLNPMSLLGGELQHRGHRVTLFGIPEVQEKISWANLNFYEIGADDYPPGSLEPLYAKMGQLSGLDGLKFAIESSLKATTMMFREATEAVAKADIDLLLIDQVTAAGGTIADYLELPFVSVCNALPLNQEPGIPPYFTHTRYQNSWQQKLSNQAAHKIFNTLTRPVWQLVASQRQQWHLSPYLNRNDAYSQLAQICQIPAALDFPREDLPPWFHYVGPMKQSPAKLSTKASHKKIETCSIPDTHSDETLPAELLALGDKPLIYANLGTLQSRNIDVFRCIAHACLDIDAQLVISLGNPKADTSKLDFPGSPLVYAFPPHQLLINHAHLVITHAGSTAVNCLSAGVPMVAIPITMDQPGMAARLAYVGAGEVVPLKKLSVSRLKTVIETVLLTTSYRDRATEMAIEIQKSGGVSYAAEIVEQVLRTQRPAMKSEIQDNYLQAPTTKH